MPTATILLLENLSFPLAFRLRYSRTSQQLPYSGLDASSRVPLPKGEAPPSPAPAPARPPGAIRTRTNPIGVPGGSLNQEACGGSGTRYSEQVIQTHKAGGAAARGGLRSLFRGHRGKGREGPIPKRVNGGSQREATQRQVPPRQKGTRRGVGEPRLGDLRSLVWGRLQPSGVN